MKNFVYLQSQSQIRVAHIASVMQRATDIFYVLRSAYIPAESSSRALPVIGKAVTRNDFDGGQEGSPLLLCPHVKKIYAI